MTRNYIIPKENFPKIEEVREIENEIPTYEEFLKNYEVDQKVNDSYENEIESYSDVGINKGFGPCSVCYKNERWNNLYAGCPADYCSNRSTSYWYHSRGEYLNASDQSSGCGTLRISNKGNIECERCGTRSSIKNWSFSCSSHRGEYRSVSNSSLQSSLMVAGDFNEMLTDLFTYLRNH